MEALTGPFHAEGLASDAARERLGRSARAYVYIHVLEGALRDYIGRTLSGAAAGDPRWLIEALDAIDPDLAPLIAGRKVAAERKRGYLDLDQAGAISYLTVAELKSLVLGHWDLFEADLQDRVQFSSLFDVIHVSRNAIAHNRGVGPGLVAQLRAQTLNLLARIGTSDIAGAGDLDPVEELFADRYGDMVAAFPTRAAARDLMQRWLAGARTIDAMGIALSELSQMTPLNTVAARILDGVECRLLLMDPDGLAVAARATAEARPTAELAGLIRASIGNLLRLRDGLPAAARARCALRIHDQVPTMSLYLLDGTRAITQVYPLGSRAVEAPVLVARDRGTGGLMPHARDQFQAAWNMARPVAQTS